MGLLAEIVAEAKAMVVGKQEATAPGEGLVRAAFANVLSPWGDAPRLSRTERLKLYQRNSWLYAAPRRIAQTAATVPLGLTVRRGPGKVEEILEHPILDVLGAANPFMTGWKLRYLTHLYMELRGEMFWLVNDSRLQRPAEIWPIPPQWVTVAATTFAGGPVGVYKVTIQGRPFEIPAESMIRFTEPDPNDPYGRGMGPGDVASNEAEVDEYTAEWRRRHFFNSARPEILVAVPNISPDNARILKEQWREKYGGFKRAYEVGIIDAEAEVTVLTQTAKDLDFIEGRRQQRDTIIGTFGVPGDILGITESSNRATAETAEYVFMKYIVEPAVAMYVDELNEQFVPRWRDPRLALRFNSPVPEDKEFSLKQAETGMKLGAISVNEWRARNGWNPVPDGDVALRPIALVEVPLAEEQAKRLPPPPARPALPAGTKQWTTEQKEAIWRQWAADSEELERAWIEVLRKTFQRQKNDAIRGLRAAFPSTKAGEEDLAFEVLVLRLLDWAASEERTRPLLDKLLAEAFERAGQRTLENLGLEVSFDLTNPGAVEWIRGRALKLVRGIDETTRAALRETLAEGVLQGESIPKLADRIADVFNQTSKVRAELIARTEVIGAFAEGTLRALRQEAVVDRVEWLTALDERVEDFCAAQQGQVYTLDASSGLIPAHPRCRCTWIPYFGD